MKKKWEANKEFYENEMAGKMHTMINMPTVVNVPKTEVLPPSKIQNNYKKKHEGFVLQEERFNNLFPTESLKFSSKRSEKFSKNLDLNEIFAYVNLSAKK